MRLAAIATALLLAQAAPSPAQAEGRVGISVQLPGVSINLGMPSQPELVLIPGLPVYYAPQVQANYFFYDGLYWVFQGDGWYFSSWFGGPWYAVSPYEVPDFILRVPVRYFHSRPVFFRDWRAEAPPRWGDYWGRDWRSRRDGWDRWDRRHPPAAAPLPSYQRRFPEGRYPDNDRQQRAIRGVNDAYRPHDDRSRLVIERERALQQAEQRRQLERAREQQVQQRAQQRREIERAHEQRVERRSEQRTQHRVAPREPGFRPTPPMTDKGGGYRPSAPRPGGERRDGGGDRHGR
ncbi:MAG: hypothetical protein R3E87_16600 [Burkholderiaceae bacterium]